MYLTLSTKHLNPFIYRYANANSEHQRSVEYKLNPADKPLKMESDTASIKYKAKHPNPAQVISQPVVSSNYGEFINEPLASISSSDGSKTYVAKKELNLLAKLIGCDEQETDDSAGTQKKFKINLFETAGINIKVDSDINV